MTVLVTGATGNVGRLVVDQLVQAGVRVRALTRNPSAANPPQSVEVVRDDLARPETLTGPEALTLREQVHAIATGIGREIRFEEVTPEQARDSMIEQGWDASVAEYVLEGYQAQSAAGPPTLLLTVEQVTGRPTRTLAQWAARHAADFR